MKLSVRNNWEVLEWFWGEDRIKIESVEAVEVGEVILEAESRLRRTTVYDHGHTYPAESDNLFVEVPVPGAGFGVWVSVYDNPSLRNAISGIIGVN